MTQKNTETVSATFLPAQC